MKCYVNIADDTRCALTTSPFAYCGYCEENVENSNLISEFDELWENFRNITDEVLKVLIFFCRLIQSLSTWEAENQNQVIFIIVFS